MNYDIVVTCYYVGGDVSGIDAMIGAEEVENIKVEDLVREFLNKRDKVLQLLRRTFSFVEKFHRSSKLSSDTLRKGSSGIRKLEMQQLKK